MSQFKYQEIGDDVYFHFAANATTGAADDGATPLYDVRLCGAASDAAPKVSGTPTLLSHGDYGAGLHEIAIDTDGWDAGEYAVFCTITVSTVAPGGFVGGFKLRTAGTAALDVNVTAIAADVITPASVDEDADFVIQALSVTNALDAGSLTVDGAVTVGDGIVVTCTTDSKSAIKATGGATAGNGMELIGTGTGIDLKADITGNITGNVSGSVGTCAAVTVTAIGNDVITPASIDEDADFVIQALSITNALDAGSVVIDGTTTLTGAVGTGAITAASVSVTGQLDAGNLLVDGTTVLTGTVGTGAATLASLTSTGEVTIGDGIVVTCSTDSKAAIKATGGATAGNGMELIGTGTGVDLKADITGNVTGNISGSVATCAAATVSAIGNDVITPASVDEDADFVIQALSITNALDAGSVLVDGTTTLTGNVSCGAGFDVVGALSANSLLIDTTTTLTGAVSCGATFDVVGELSANSVLVDVGTVLTGAVSTGAVTAASVSVTGQLDAGNLLVDGTTVLTGTVGTGAITAASASITGQLDAGNVVVDAGMDVVGALSANSLLIDTTTTLTGNVSLGGTLGVTGITTFTGAVNANITGDITGNVSGSVGTCAAATVSAIGENVITGTSLHANACTKIIDDFETQSQADPTGFHVNIKEINGTAVAGDGGATPWGP